MVPSIPLRRAAALSWLPLAFLLGPSAASANGDAGPSGRLRTDVVPVLQTIELDLDPGQARYVGSVRVELNVRSRVRSFAFHAEEMDLRSLELTGPTGEVAIRHDTGERGRVVVEAATALAPGKYTLKVAFENDFDTRASGLYKAVAGGEAYLFTQFEPDDARKAFPCWDEPSFKFPYQIEVTVPAVHMALSNTPIESETAKGNRRTVVFKKTPPMPSYLLALAIGPLEAVPIGGMPIPGRVITPRGASGLAGEAARITPRILAALERYFGRPYPYEKLDLIAVPEFWFGAMENPGAITFRDSLLLLDPRGASAGQRLGLATITAHELGHMWFGDLVTMVWWDDLWLNESFASWIADKVTSEVFPEYRVDAEAVRAIQFAMTTDARLSARAVRHPVGAADNLQQSFDALAYSKGQAVLEMVEAWLGPEAFRKGVLDYLAAHEWGNAAGADLWNALAKASGKEVGPLLETFLDQPGVPLVSVESVADRRVTLSQRRFLNDGVRAAPARWRVPVRLRFEDEGGVHAHSALLDRERDVVLLPGRGTVKWVHPNAGEVGYYRWRVPSSTLQQLADSAVGTMSLRERVGFVGNLQGLLDAGALRGEEFLRLMPALARDPDPQVVSAVVGGLGRVKTAFITPELKEPFTLYVRRTLGPALERFGLSRREGEAETVSLLRPQLLVWLGREGADARILQHARQQVEKYLLDPASADPSVIGTALSLAALSGDRALFDEYRRRVESAQVPIDRERFLSALGSFREPQLTEEALRYALAGPLRAHEIFTIPWAVSTWVGNKERAYRFLVENLDAIRGRIPAMSVAFLPHLALAWSCSRAQAAEAQKFFSDPARRVPGGEEELAKAIEAVNDCAALRAREGAAAASYLRSLR